MKSAILATLLAAAGMTQPAKLAAVEGQFATDLIKKIGDIPEADWDALPDEACDYYNELVAAHKAKTPYPAPPDAQPDDEPATRSRSRAAPATEPPEDFKPKVGMVITLTTSRGKEVTGKVVELSKKEIVLSVDGSDEEFSLERVASMGPAGEQATPPDEGPADPEVGDTVQLETTRGKIVMGIITELTEDVVTVKDTTGDVDDYSRDRLKSLVVKAKGTAPAQAPAPAAGRGRASAGTSADADAGKGRTSKSSNGGVPVTTRARELIVENLGATAADIQKMLAKEGLEFKEQTIQLVFSEAHKLIAMLKAAGKLK